MRRNENEFGRRLTMSKIFAKNLPEGWYWLERSMKLISKGEYDEGDLYSPHDCRAGEVRKSAYSVLNHSFYSYTWDEDGTGGENSTHTSLENAKAFVEAAILRQGFHMTCNLNCSDHGDVEVAAEIAEDVYRDLGDNRLESHETQARLRDIVEAMLGPKRFKEWCENSIGFGE